MVRVWSFPRANLSRSQAALAIKIFIAFVVFYTVAGIIIRLTEKDPVAVALVSTGLDLKNKMLRAHLSYNEDEIGADKKDNDENGLVDDVLGWDFLQNSADVSDFSGAGTQSALAILQSYNRANILPIKVARDVADGSADHVAKGVLYALSRKAKVILVTPILQRGSDSLFKSIEKAEKEGAIVVIPVVAPGISYPRNYGKSIVVGSRRTAKGREPGLGKDISLSVTPIYDELFLKDQTKSDAIDSATLAAATVSGYLARVVEQLGDLDSIDLKRARSLIRDLLQSQMTRRGHPDHLEHVIEGRALLDPELQSEI